jgi:glycosyltransferase involved in cell wall biosynthesis
VVRLGFVDDRRRADLFAGARVFAYPSRYEGFGLAPLEAMAAGTPVVTTRVGSLPQVLGDAASFVEPSDRTGLTIALARLLDDSDERSALVAKGLDRAAHFSWDACADGLIRLYERLC